MAFRNRRSHQRQEITPLIHNFTAGYVIFKTCAFCMLSAIAAYITVMSGMSGVNSGGASGGIVSDLLNGFLQTFNIAVDSVTFDKIFTALHSALRKLMHVTEFGALTACVFFSFEHIRRSLLISGIFAVIYAGADEIHQYFIPGRVCTYTDVLIDSIGIFAVLAVLILMSKFVYTYKDKALYVRTNGLMVK